jgi:acyl dehydratase
MNGVRAVSVIDGIAGLRSSIGRDLGVSAWRAVAQQDVDDFARLTGDDQWIHVDVERAAASPFGGTVVHGFLLLALGPVLAAQVVEVRGFSHGLNYGLERIRLPSVLPVGSPIRLRLALAALTDVENGVRAEYAWTFEREGDDKPVCVASKLTQYLGPTT